MRRHSALCAAASQLVLTDCNLTHVHKFSRNDLIEKMGLVSYLGTVQAKGLETLSQQSQSSTLVSRRADALWGQDFLGGAQQATAQGSQRAVHRLSGHKTTSKKCSQCSLI